MVTQETHITFQVVEPQVDHLGMEIPMMREIDRGTNLLVTLEE